jgi:hypothetical protein
MATPQGIWIGAALKDQPSLVPDSIRAIIEQQSADSSKLPKSVNRVRALFRLSSNSEMFSIGSGRDPESETDPDARQAALKEVEELKATQEIIQTMYKEKPHGIHVDLRSTANGLRCSATLEEVYLAIFAKFFNENFLPGLDAMMEEGPKTEGNPAN